MIVEETKHIYQEVNLIYSFASQKLNGCSIEVNEKEYSRNLSWCLKLLISPVKMNKQKLIYSAILNKDKEYKLTSDDQEIIFGELKEDNYEDAFCQLLN